MFRAIPAIVPTSSVLQPLVLRILDKKSLTYQVKHAPHFPKNTRGRLPKQKRPFFLSYSILGSNISLFKYFELLRRSAWRLYIIAPAPISTYGLA